MGAEERRLGAGDWLTVAAATWFGSGLLPKAPGTWGTLAAIPLVALLAVFLDPWLYALAVGALLVLSIPVSSRCARLYREHPAVARLNPKAAKFDAEMLNRWVKSEERQAEDPGLIVIDEVVGYGVAMIGAGTSISAFVLAFLFFRAFDIFKIPPGKALERLGGGAGIVLDDVMAGLYACACVHGVLLLARAMGFILP